MPEPTITFGAAQSFGALTGWGEQSTSSDVMKDRAAALDNVGNEAASKVFNQRTEVSATYKAQSTSAPTVPAAIGALVNSLIATSIALTTSQSDFAQMVLGGHNHAANAHTSSPALRTGTHGVTLSLGFGATDFLGGTAGSNASVMSSTCTITCQHADEMDNDGDHQVGQNYTATLDATVTWLGVPTTAIGGAGWDNVSVRTETNNQGFLQTVAHGVKSISMS